MPSQDADRPGSARRAQKTEQGTCSHAEMTDFGELQRCLAPVTSADLFKSQKVLQLPRSTFDVSSVLSYEASLRQPSSLKAGSLGLKATVISLATGRPSPDTYPFEWLEFGYTDAHCETDLQTDCRSPQHPAGARSKRTRVSGNDAGSAVDLSIALSYGYSLGHEQLIQFLTTHISHVHYPPYSDWEVCLTCGNTSALEIAFRNFTNPGDSVLVEKYTYSGAIEAARPLGLFLVPIKMDRSGLCPESLNETLTNWSFKNPDKPKPKILYTIPTGQNPTGITQPITRRLAVLEVAERHNLLLIEDDPYYYLQFSQSGGCRRRLLSSYLTLSTSGRVLRLDSTSKILAPGLRLGWLTGPKSLVQTFQASHDLSIVHPSGVSQVITYKLLSEAWGHDGFLQWLCNLARIYSNKATTISNALQKFMGAGELAKVCSWAPIEAGMFLWLKVDCTTYPGLKNKTQSQQEKNAILLQIEDDIYTKALEDGVLCCKGSFFNVRLVHRLDFEHGNGEGKGESEGELSIHIRLTFACADSKNLFIAAEVLSRAISVTFGLL